MTLETLQKVSKLSALVGDLCLLVSGSAALIALLLLHGTPASGEERLLRFIAVGAWALVVQHIPRRSS